MCTLSQLCHGYVEGQNVVLELRFGEGKAEEFPILAAELVRLKVDVILALTNPVIDAVRQATQTIPIVMVGPNRGKRIFEPDYISRVMDESLRRLQTDYIDLYQLHNPTVEVIERGAVWEVLERAKKAGKIRHYGVSINSTEEGTAAVKDGRAETIQVEYNLLAQEPAETFFPAAQQANIGVIARVPLKRGILTGKLKQSDEQRFQGEDVRARSFKGEAFAQELAKAEQLKFLAHGPVQSLGQAAIAFCIAHPAVSVVIPGARNAEQMRENASAADVEIPAADLDKISDLRRRNFAV